MRELDPGDGPGLCGLINGERGDVTDAEFIRNAVTVAVLARPGYFNRLHAKLIVAGVTHKSAHRAGQPFPLQRFDHQIRVDAINGGGDDKAVGLGDQVAKGHAFAGQADGHVCAGFLCFGQGGIVLLLQVGGHFLGQQLQGTDAKDMRRLAVDKFADITGHLWVSDVVLRYVAGTVAKGKIVAGGTALRIGTSRPRGKVCGPGALSGQVGARHQGKPLAVADVGAAALRSSKIMLKKFIAGFKGKIKGLLRFARRGQLVD